VRRALLAVVLAGLAMVLSTPFARAQVDLPSEPAKEPEKAPPAPSSSAAPAPSAEAPAPSSSAEAKAKPEGAEKKPAAAAKEAAKEPKTKRPPVPPGLSEERTLPEYDPRGPRPTTVGDVAIWVPRVIFFPPYLVTEYLVRKPLGFFVSTVERKQWHIAVFNFLTTADHKAGIIPTALVDFGFKPSVGLYGFADDFIWQRNDVRAHFGTWGPRWINAGITDRVRLANDATVAAVAEFLHRPDAVFYGLGPRSTNEMKSRYTQQIADVGVEYVVPFMHWSFFRARSGFRQGKFEAEGCCGTELAQRVAAGELALPPGFDGYKIGYQSLLLTLDTRMKRPNPESGFRVELAAEDMQQAQANGRNFIRWGGIGAAYLDLGRARTVALKTTVRFADSLKGDDIPFAEQVVLGGARQMRGYLPGRLVGRSAAVAEIEYRWPVWVWLDGTMHAALGNVFGTHLEGFSTKLLRLSTGIGLRSNGSPDHSFEILTGFGTETFEDGLRVTSFRFVVGGTRGF
jgi:hypothetical protein